MAIEFPSDLIEQLQISLRKEAGVPLYNPEDVSLRDLPSVQEAVEGLDPSPPYLRCKQCRGKLLRGIQSIVCVYCGAQQQQHKDIPPDPINFKSTFGYRWLLQSLNLNGTEPVEANHSNQGQNSSKDAMILSDLLNIEITWSAESEKNENNIAEEPNLNKNPLNAAGVDLDSFFSETNKDSVPYTSEQHEIPNKEALASPGQGSLSLFKNIQSTDTLARSAEGATDDSSGWEAEFKSAAAGTLPVDLIPLDLFPAASPIDFSSTSEAPLSSEGQMKFQFDGVDSNLKDKNPTVSQASMNDNWFQDDRWHTSSIEPSIKIAQPEAIIDGKLTESSKNRSSDDMLFSDDIWLTSSEKPRDNEESVDAWQNFTRSGNVPDPFPSVSSLTSNTETSTNGLGPEMNLFNGSSNDQDMDLGSFMAPDIFSGTTGLHNCPTALNNMQEGSHTDRLEVKPGEHNSVEDTDGIFDGAMRSVSADNTVERLMSEMHDLSFMLDSNLSIPQEKDAV